MSPACAFLVQFSMAGRGGCAFAGHAEHILSGRSADFSSPQELMAFLREALGDVGRR
jgi:hypothetical protein